MFRLAAAIVPHRTTVKSELSDLLTQRMNGPQRHRLLHGFPLAGALPRVSPDTEIALPDLSQGTRRPLLIGVLPHPFCNPRVAACGFCTFPHEAFRSDRISQVSAAVCREITARANAEPELSGREVTGLYFGGGTANLTPPDDFRRLCRLLNATFDLTQAEITLEGIPAMFLTRQQALLNILQNDVSTPRVRFSMGIQTFDDARLRTMGRQAFGNTQTFADVTAAAHARGWTASADLLFNLPDQTLPQMQHDVQQAIDIGLDQICLYHLVMFRGLGTPWSKDETLLAGLPDNHSAADNWLVLREQMLDAGFVQTSLTNFERREVHHSSQRFIYEERGFQPENYEMLGFGPCGISFQANEDFSAGVKTVNPDNSADYVAAIEHPGRIWDRYFAYESSDLKIFALTRWLAALNISVTNYEQTFGNQLGSDFAPELDLLIEQRLITVEGTNIRPTPRGMFYADSMAGLLAQRRLQQLRISSRAARQSREVDAKIDSDELDDLNGNGHGFM